MKKYLGVLFAVLLTVACLVVPASAADAPDYDAGSIVNKYYPNNSASADYSSILYYFDGYYRLYVWRTSPNVNCVYDLTSSQLTFNSSSYSDTILYSFLYSSSTWGGASSSSFKKESPFVVDLPDCEFHSSTVDIHDSNGDLFFPLPLPWEVQTLEAVTGQAPALVTAKLTTTLDCLVPLGIGLMALFVGLLLLRKVFYRFQVKS